MTRVLVLLNSFINAEWTAPPECIQYFTQNNGVVKAYNWKDWPLTRGARQLANQDLRMCFRREQMNIYGQVNLPYTIYTYMFEYNSCNFVVSFMITSAKMFRLLPKYASVRALFLVEEEVSLWLVWLDLPIPWWALPIAPMTSWLFQMVPIPLLLPIVTVVKRLILLLPARLLDQPSVVSFFHGEMAFTLKTFI